MNRFERQEIEDEAEYELRLGREALVASMAGDPVPADVAEHIESTAEPFDLRLSKARVAFGQGEEAVVDYLLGK